MGTKMTSCTRAQIGLLLAALFVGVSASAQTDGLRIGVVDFRRLLDQAPQAGIATEALQEEFAPRQREIAALQRSLQEKQETYERDGAIMGETERLNLEREIRGEQRDMTREQTEYIEDLDIRRNEELTRLQASLIQEVQIYSRAQGYDLVVADPLYYGSAVDITDEVLSSLEADFATEE